MRRGRHGRPDGLAIIVLDREHLLGDDERGLGRATLALDLGGELDSRGRTDHGVGVVSLDESFAELALDPTPGLGLARNTLGSLVESFADFTGQRDPADHETRELPDGHLFSS